MYTSHGFGLLFAGLSAVDASATHHEEELYTSLGRGLLIAGVEFILLSLLQLHRWKAKEAFSLKLQYASMQ